MVLPQSCLVDRFNSNHFIMAGAFLVLSNTLQNHLFKTFYPQVMGVETFDKLPFLSAMHHEKFFKFIPNFDCGFQTICRKGRTENQYFFYTILGQTLDLFFGVWLNPWIFAQSRLEKYRVLIFAKLEFFCNFSGSRRLLSLIRQLKGAHDL